jgi:hypothetical protein
MMQGTAIMFIGTVFLMLEYSPPGLLKFVLSASCALVCGIELGGYKMRIR